MIKLSSVTSGPIAGLVKVLFMSLKLSSALRSKIKDSIPFLLLVSLRSYNLSLFDIFTGVLYDITLTGYLAPFFIL